MPRCRILTHVHPVLFHIGPVVVPSYGALAALGVLLALLLAQHTARVAGIDAGQVWNLCVLALFSALIGQRVLLVLLNWSVLRIHPSWLLGLAMVHHPLLGAVGTLAGGGVALLFARIRKLPLRATADALASPLALGFAFEQFGSLLAGAGFGVEAAPQLPWAVIYTSPLAARWGGTPLGIPLHPVQAYAALLYLMLAVFLLVWQPLQQRAGDLTGLWLLASGVILFVTELWRDRIGRGSLLGGAIDGPQIAGIVLVLAGGWMLLEFQKTGSSELRINEVNATEESRAGHG